MPISYTSNITICLSLFFTLKNHQVSKSCKALNYREHLNFMAPHKKLTISLLRSYSHNLNPLTRGNQLLISLKGCSVFVIGWIQNYDQINPQANL